MFSPNDGTVCSYFQQTTWLYLCNEGWGGGDRILADLSKKTFDCVNAEAHLESKAQLLNGLNASRVADSKTKELILVTISTI